METVLYIFAQVVIIFLDVISFAMFLRVILQFFVDVTENKFYLFCVMLTEPIIIPFRIIFDKFNIGVDSPLDLPFLAAALSLSVITLFLPIL